MCPSIGDQARCPCRRHPMPRGAGCRKMPTAGCDRHGSAHSLDQAGRRQCRNSQPTPADPDMQPAPTHSPTSPTGPTWVWGPTAQVTMRGTHGALHTSGPSVDRVDHVGDSPVELSRVVCHGQDLKFTTFGAIYALRRRRRKQQQHTTARLASSRLATTHASPPPPQRRPQCLGDCGRSRRRGIGVDGAQRAAPVTSPTAGWNAYSHSHRCAGLAHRSLIRDEGSRAPPRRCKDVIGHTHTHSLTHSDAASQENLGSISLISLMHISFHSLIHLTPPRRRAQLFAVVRSERSGVSEVLSTAPRSADQRQRKQHTCA